MTKKNILFALGLGLLFSLFSCASDYDEIKITNIQKISLSTLMNAKDQLDLHIEVDNAEKKTVVIRALELKATNQKGHALATVKLIEPVLILKQQKQYYRFALEMNVDDPLAGFLAYNQLRKGQQNIRVEGFLKVKSGLFSRTIKINQDVGKETFNLFQTL